MKNKGYAIFFSFLGGAGGGANKVHKWRIDRTNESVNNSQSRPPSLYSGGAHLIRNDLEVWF